MKRCGAITNSKRKRESCLLDELLGEHSYLLYELSREDERHTMMFWRDGEKIHLRPGSAIRLVVPSDSSLGREIEAMRKDGKRKRVREEKAKQKRRARRKVVS